MWRSAFILLLLIGSSASAAEARGVLHVGITITGSAAAAPANATSSDKAVAGSLAGSRAAVVKSSVRARPRGHSESNVRKQSQ